ncbi:unnamed protein product [Timema podura]|uniref:ELP3-like N-terminal domain-containing protein n=1 Tax=Timema podura TaxID=61482 RepID=A0ABN7NSF2_TIMPD|nr:unnamed protein product [Timema podura]
MGRNKKVSNLSREERMVITIAEIIQELLYAHEIGKDVNLNKMKTRISSKYGLETSPRLVDIIAALPTDHKKTLLPKLKAKPIRTASGVSISGVEHGNLRELALARMKDLGTDCRDVRTREVGIKEIHHKESEQETITEKWDTSSMVLTCLSH